jgi:hypothetical protein
MNTLASHSKLPSSRSAATLTLLHGLLFVATLVVLGSAIGWPGILRQPPTVVFERISAAMTATKLGYTSYLLSSLLMIPLAFLLRDLFARAGAGGWWNDCLAFIGAAAGVLKAMGIARWLLTMPMLADRYGAATTPAAREMLEAVFTGVNAYGGSLGELLGVQLFSGIWFAGVSLLLLQRLGQRFVGGFGLLVSALTLAMATRIFLPQAGALEMVSGPLWLVWLVCLSVALWRGERRGRVSFASSAVAT